MSNEQRLHDIGLPEDFPMGIRVLVVDDDQVFLKIVIKLLLDCGYKVTVFSRSTIALSHLRKNKNDYDIVLADVMMPDKDGFELLQIVLREMDLPVILVSARDDFPAVKKGIDLGACQYLVKPLRKEELNNIWQYVHRKRLLRKKIASNYSFVFNDNGDDNNEEDEVDTSSSKKKHFVWTTELKMKFVDAVNLIGIDRATPLRIHQVMNVPGITRLNISSHLQKYRTKLMKKATQDQNLGLRYNFPASNVSKENVVENTAFLSTELLRQRRDFFAVPETDNLLFKQASVQNPNGIPLEWAIASKENMNIQGTGFMTDNTGDPNSFSNQTFLPALGNHFPMNQTSQPPTEFQLPSLSTKPYMDQLIPQNQMNLQQPLQYLQQSVLSTSSSTDGTEWKISQNNKRHAQAWDNPSLVFMIPQSQTKSQHASSSTRPCMDQFIPQNQINFDQPLESMEQSLLHTGYSSRGTVGINSHNNPLVQEWDSLCLNNQATAAPTKIQFLSSSTMPCLDQLMPPNEMYLQEALQSVEQPMENLFGTQLFGQQPFNHHLLGTQEHRQPPPDSSQFSFESLLLETQDQSEEPNKVLSENP